MGRIATLVVALALAGFIALDACAQAAGKPNPFARFDKNIQDLEEKIGSLDAEKDKKKIEGFQKKLEKERDNKDKALQRMLDPLEKKLEALETKQAKLEEKDQPTEKVVQEIKAINDKMAEIEDLARPPQKEGDAADGEQVDDAAKKSKDALKGMM